MSYNIKQSLTNFSYVVSLIVIDARSRERESWTMVGIKRSVETTGCLLSLERCSFVNRYNRIATNHRCLCEMMPSIDLYWKPCLVSPHFTTQWQILSLNHKIIENIWKNIMIVNCACACMYEYKMKIFLYIVYSIQERRKRRRWRNFTFYILPDYNEPYVLRFTLVVLLERSYALLMI